MQLVDVAACMAAWSLGKRVVTQQVSLNFTRSVKLGGSIRIEASVVHAGATSVLVETSIKDEDGRTCLLSTALLHVTGTIDPGDPLPEPLPWAQFRCRVVASSAMVIRFHAPLLCVDGEYIYPIWAF